MSSAARSVSVNVSNFLPNDLTRSSVSLDHGILTANSPPPETIRHGSAQAFSVESQGVMTGVEGTIKYSIKGASAELVIYVDNPYAGSNSYSISLDGSDKDKYDVSYTGGSGDNASILISLSTKE